MLQSCFWIALVIFAISFLFFLVRALSKYKSGRLLTPSKILFGGVILSGFVLYLPILFSSFEGKNSSGFDKVAASLYQMIRMFIIEGDFEDIADNVTQGAGICPAAYTAFFSILFIVSALLTFGFVLSFFRNASAYRRYFFHYTRDVFVFSQLNEKSCMLAQSLSATKGRLLVFTNVDDQLQEQGDKLVENARELGAICFKKDIISMNFAAHKKRRELNFFLISEDQTENVDQAIKLLPTLVNRNAANLYVFSTQVEAEMLLTRAYNELADNTKVKVRRINEVQSLILNNLYENGYEKLFKSAYDDGTGVKRINAVVIGMGQHGTEMTKALTWVCQMDGYLPEIHTFDIDPMAEERFASQCPELMEFSGKLDIPGETTYTLSIHSGVDVDTATFDRLVAALPKTTYVFVALGNDEKNIATAVKLRAMFEGLGYKPEIQAVVYDFDKNTALDGITNYRNQSYNIDFIGDRKTSYSEQVILNCAIEKTALSRHMKWGEEHQFWQYNYNYKSSVASVVHKKLREECDIPGVKVAPAQRTDEELWAIRIMEHRRWNAYMRSEGYRYSGSDKPESRNDLAKRHHCLIPFDRLSVKDKEKDDD
jgi:hypothetical protein